MTASARGKWWGKFSRACFAGELADVFEKNEKKNETTSVYRLQSWPKGFGTLLLPPPLFGRKLVSDRQSTVVNLAMPGFPPPPLPLNKVEAHTLTRFFKSVWQVTPNTVQGGGGL